MTEHIIYCNQATAPNAELNEWLVANGVDPQDVVCTELTINDDQLTYTAFVHEDDPRVKTLDPRGGGFLKRHRTVPILVPFPAELNTNNSEKDDQ